MLPLFTSVKLPVEASKIDGDAQSEAPYAGARKCPLLADAEEKGTIL